MDTPADTHTSSSQPQSPAPTRPGPEIPDTSKDKPEIPQPTLPTPELPGPALPEPELPDRGDPRQPENDCRVNERKVRNSSIAKAFFSR